MEEPFGLVTVTCVQARGLQVPALYGLTRGRRPDCYVELGLGKTPPKKSAIVQGSAEPNWRRQNISFELSLGRLAKELHVRVCDAARDGAVLGSATVDLSPLLSGRETQVDRWLDLVGGGAQQQPKGARVRLALAFDVLAGDVVRLSGLWPERAESNAAYPLRADEALRVVEARGDDVLVRYYAKSKHEERFVLCRNALRLGEPPSHWSAGSSAKAGTASGTVVDALSRSASALASSPAAEAFSATAQRALESESLSASGALVAREGLANLKMVLERWSVGGTSAAKHDVLYALGAAAMPAVLPTGDFQDAADDDDDRFYDAEATAPPSPDADGANAHDGANSHNGHRHGPAAPVAAAKPAATACRPAESVSMPGAASVARQVSAETSASASDSPSADGAARPPQVPLALSVARTLFPSSSTPRKTKAPPQPLSVSLATLSPSSRPPAARRLPSPQTRRSPSPQTNVGAAPLGIPIASLGGNRSRRR